MKYYIGEIKHYLNHFFSKNNKSPHLKELRENGITILPDFLSEEECQFHIGEINNLIDKKKISWQDTLKSDFRIYGYENLVYKALELFSKADPIYGSYIDFKTNNSFLMANKVCFEKDNLGSGGGWHRDSLNRRQLKFMIYLCDVDAENGPFEYVPKTHKLKSKLNTNHFLNRRVRYTNDEIDIYKKTLPSKLFTAKKGTCIIFDSSGLHRGTPLKKGVRYAITKYMFDSKIPIHIKKMIINDPENNK